MNERAGAMGEARKQRLIEKLANQTADLVNKAGIEPTAAAEIYLDLALALAIRSGVSPLECAVTLRSMATRLEELDAQEASGPA
jgi:hypothetical protein